MSSRASRAVSAFSKASASMSAPAHRRIDEIEGLRGLALTLVVLFHLFGHGRVSGGVDVFLFVSGFLLTLTLLRTWSVGRPLNLPRRYSRILLRLTPPALLVLAATTVMTVLVLPRSTWVQTAHEIIASALYYENWELISSQLAYGAAGPLTSPVQHFWSLSVQGQFFLVWPVLIALLLVLARRTAWTVPLVATVVGAATSASFVYAWSFNATEPTVAYFDSFTRFWEIGAGALLAIFFTTVNRVPRAMRVVLGWTGAALIVGSGFVLDGAAQFPGPAALVPVLGAAFIIACAGEPTRFGVDRALATAPTRFVARISYPLYLWHWPVLIAYLAIRGFDGVGLLGGAFVLVVSGALAWLTQRFVSDPITAGATHRPRKRYPVAAVAAAAALTVVVSTGAAAFEQAGSASMNVAAGETTAYPGATSLTTGEEVAEDVDPVPDASVAFEDLPDVYAEHCIQNSRDQPRFAKVLTCAPRGDVDSQIDVVLTGGSHAQQWSDTVTAVAERNGWRLTIIDKDACRLTRAQDVANTACRDWNTEAIAQIIDLHPAAVITLATKTWIDGPETSNPGEVAAWQELDEAGIPVIGIRDTPRFPWRVPECLEQHVDAPEECGIDRARLFSAVSPTDVEPGVPDSFVELDLTDGFCTAERCEPVVGNVTVYRDDDHMTATYSRTLVPLLDDLMREGAPSLYDDRA